MTTIKEIAKACGVSVATVSNIINNKGSVGNETRKRVTDAIREMNYTPNIVAKNLKMKQTRSIGVIAEDMTVFSMPEIIDGITEYCEQEDYQILLTNLRLYKKFSDSYYRENMHTDLVHKEMQKLLSKQVEGIIYVAAHERLINFMPEDIPIPTVVAYGYTKDVKIPSVIVDDVSGAYDIMNYLIGLGHKDIGIIAGKKDSAHTQARLEGCQKALFDNGLLYNPKGILYGEWDRESGYKHTDELIKRGVSAVFCMNDIMAGGVYDRLSDLNLQVGKDISVVGYDNRDIASYTKPPLTTVSLPLHQIGYEASKIIVSILNNEPIDESGAYYVPCNICMRKSVIEKE
ncbi:MAG: LacI family DNA-binding transcriptional regulator [Suipraeoptans sp.]